MKTYIANEASIINYLAVKKDGKWLYFLVEPSGIFSSKITSKDNAFESLSADDKIDFLKSTCRLLSLLESEDFNLDDLKVVSGDFDVPEWLLLDDYRQSEMDVVLHTTTNALIELMPIESKTVATFYGATESEVVQARKFVQDLDEYYKRESE